MVIPADLETIPQQPEASVKQLIAETIEAPAQMTKADTIAEWHAGAGKYAGVKDAAIEEAYRRTGLDGSKGSICSISWAYDLHMEPFQLFATPGEMTEGELLETFYRELKKELRGQPPQFAGHYIGGFDLKFLFHRSVILGIQPPFDIGQWGQHIAGRALPCAGHQHPIAGRVGGIHSL